MLDDIFNALFSILDSAGTIAGSKNRSSIFKVLGCIVWILLFVGIIGIFIYWFSN